MITFEDIHQSLDLAKQGMVLVNKPAGITSHSVVQQARKIFQTRKVGHTGTLDPFSTGLLLLLVGETVSLQQHFTARPKIYRALFKFGVTTDTLDITGKITKTNKRFSMPTRKEIQDHINSNFIGKTQQTPPSFSAVKVKGRRAYTLARAGKKFTIPERTIKIDCFKILSLIDQEIEVKISCSSGTYIRSLAYDLAQDLGTVGMVTSLVREQIGNYYLENAMNLELQQGIDKKTYFNKSFDVLHKTFPAIIPINTLIEKENFLNGIRIKCSPEEFFKAKNGNFSFSFFKNRNGLFHLVHKNSVFMIVEKKENKTKILFNLLKYIDFKK